MAAADTLIKHDWPVFVNTSFCFKQKNIKVASSGFNGATFRLLQTSIKAIFSSVYRKAEVSQESFRQFSKS
jgi:hypothetical protein